MSDKELLKRVLDFLALLHRKNGLDESMLNDLVSLTVDVHIATHHSPQPNEADVVDGAAHALYRHDNSINDELVPDNWETTAYKQCYLNKITALTDAGYLITKRGM